MTTPTGYRMLIGGKRTDASSGTTRPLTPSGARSSRGSRTPPPKTCGLARRVRDQVAAEREPHPVREWLLFFARTAVQDVARRLEQAGYLRHARGWIPGRPGRWVPVNADWAYAPIVRIHSALDPGYPADPRKAALAGLARACGLGFRIAQARAPGDRGAGQAASLPGPELRHLIAQVQAAVDSAVLSHRA